MALSMGAHSKINSRVRALYLLVVDMLFMHWSFFTPSFVSRQKAFLSSEVLTRMSVITCLFVLSCIWNVSICISRTFSAVHCYLQSFGGFNIDSQSSQNSRAVSVRRLMQKGYVICYFRLKCLFMFHKKGSRRHRQRLCYHPLSTPFSSSIDAKNVSIWASSILMISSFQGSSNILYLTTLWAADQMHLCAL